MQIGEFWSHTFLQDRIRPSDTVFDIGTNYGGFAAAVSPYCKRVIGYEPNPFWNGNRPSLPANVNVVTMAVAAHKGAFPLHVEPNGGPRSSFHAAVAVPGASSVMVDAITFAEALAAVPSGRIGLVKLDIEGEELAVLQHAPAELLSRIAQMTVEFEDFHGENAIRSVIARMKRLGFWVVKFSWRNHGDILFVNNRLEPMSFLQHATIILVYKYWRGFLRAARRMMGRAGV